ncbi:MAG: tripartite tricarboxylate transporter substrate binding protein [Betaproteobacteria bacterium]|nr:MAG: tripartite tricarboxylate transporter substrate binding protein [Betaproteobacteria bacterium]
MKIESRTRSFAAACVACVAAGSVSPVAAQAYPVKTVRIVVGFPAGGATDIVARAIAQNLNQAFGQPVIVDNRPGAASNIGADHVAKSPPDGYTLLMGSISLANNATLYSKLPYNALRDFAAVIHVTNTPFMLCVHPSVPARSVKDLVAFAKARPGQVQYGTAGNGSGAHLFTELFRSMAGIELQNIPYKGAAPALSDLLGGQVAFVFDNVVGVAPLHKSGKIRCLAVSSKVRSAIAPDIPTMQEAGIKGYEADAWFGLFAPAATPTAAIERVNGEVNRALSMPAIRQRFEALGCEPAGGTPAQFAAYFRAEIEKWRKVIRSADIRLE